MATYLIINTGGTIGMVPGNNGLEPSEGVMSNALSTMPELAEWHNHQLIWQHWSPLLDSSELQPKHWFDIQKTIQQHSDVDGVLVIHGTDTLSYTAAALSFLLDTLYPVVITGSMHPILSADTDAIGNLKLSLQALQSKRSEVIVAVGSELLPGSRINKASTARFDAFDAPYWQDSSWDVEPAQHQIKLDRLTYKPNIGVFTLFPGCSYQPLIAMVNENVDAIVINAFGNGNGPNHSELNKGLALAKEQNIPVLVRSQCLEGEVDFGQYAAGAVFSKNGAIGCGTMTFEAVITKLTLLFSSFANEEVVKEFLTPYAREWQ